MTNTYSNVSVEDFVSKLNSIYAPLIRGILGCPHMSEPNIDGQVKYLVDASREILSLPSIENTHIRSSTLEYYSEYFGAYLTKYQIYGYKPFLFKLLGGILALVRCPKNYVAIATIREACDDLETHYKHRGLCLSK